MQIMLMLNRNPTDEGTEIEQAAFEPNNLAPGVGLTPDKMLLARVFSYADAHRARLGVNDKQIPVHGYSKDGAMRVENVSDPVCAPNSKGGPVADPSLNLEVAIWSASGDFVRAAYTPRQDDDDFSWAGDLAHKVMDDAQRDRLISNVVGHLRERGFGPAARAGLRLLAQDRCGHRGAHRRGLPEGPNRATRDGSPAARIAVECGASSTGIGGIAPRSRETGTVAGATRCGRGRLDGRASELPGRNTSILCAMLRSGWGVREESPFSLPLSTTGRPLELPAIARYGHHKPFSERVAVPPLHVIGKRGGDHRPDEDAQPPYSPRHLAWQRPSGDPTFTSSR